MNVAHRSPDAPATSAGSPLSVEAALLLRVARSVCRSTAGEPAPTPPPATFEWDFFFELAARNHLSTAVYRLREHQLVKGMPEATVQRFREAYLGMMQHGLRLATLWREVVPALDAVGLRVLAYKGRALAEELYGEAAARHVWDVDIMLESREAAERARAVLRYHGFESLLPNPRRTHADVLARDCEIIMVHERSGAHVELHWRLLPSVFGELGASDFMWEGARKSLVEGASCWTAAPGATLRMLLVHGGIKHNWSEVRQVADIARWLHRYPGEPIDRILDSIPSRRSRARASAGLVLATQMLGAAIRSGEVHARLLDSPAVDFAALAAGRMLNKRGGLPGLAEWRENARWLAGNNRAVAPSRYALAMLTPEFQDVTAVEGLPAAFRPVSVPIRAARLVFRAGSVTLRAGQSGRTGADESAPQ